jgi:hypothetical protein
MSTNIVRRAIRTVRKLARRRCDCPRLTMPDASTCAMCWGDYPRDDLVQWYCDSCPDVAVCVHCLDALNRRREWQKAAA